MMMYHDEMTRWSWMEFQQPIHHPSCILRVSNSLVEHPVALKGSLFAADSHDNSLRLTRASFTLMTRPVYYLKPRVCEVGVGVRTSCTFDYCVAVAVNTDSIPTSTAEEDREWGMGLSPQHALRTYHTHLIHATINTNARMICFTP